MIELHLNSVIRTHVGTSRCIQTLIKSCAPSNVSAGALLALLLSRVRLDCPPSRPAWPALCTPSRQTAPRFALTDMLSRISCCFIVLLWALTQQPRAGEMALTAWQEHVRIYRLLCLLAMLARRHLRCAVDSSSTRTHVGQELHTSST